MSAQSSTRICIIDDDDAVRDSLGELLRAFGYEVRDFASALDYLNRDSREDNFACAIVDLHMPGMNGIELLEHVQANKTTTPFVMITGRSDSALKERARRGGAFAMLDKPVGDSALIDAIEKAKAA